MFDFSSERVTRSVDESLQRLQLGISFFFFIHLIFKVGRYLMHGWRECTLHGIFLWGV